MTSFSDFAARLRGFMARASPGEGDEEFNQLSLALFALQCAHNPPYSALCRTRRRTPETISHWTQIPAMPTTAFKEWELTSLQPTQRIAVFHSSGTTKQRPSRHYHSAESLALYEASMLNWFRRNVLADGERLRVIALTPPGGQVPHSSLVHMFEMIKGEHSTPGSTFCGHVEGDTWVLDLERVVDLLRAPDNTPVLLLGTAFLFVHLLDYLAAQNLQFQLPPGSRVMETGGYKGRSRTLPKAELHDAIRHRLGVPDTHLLCEYGMSELSSQAYDRDLPVTMPANSSLPRVLRFPPWARALVVSPETGAPVADGETGLLRIYDLANVWSVMAVQTEDLAVRRDGGFELMGRAAHSEPRGCSLMAN